MTTRSQKRKAVAELVSGDFETSITENFPPETLVASSSKIPRIEPENLAEIKTSLRKEIMSDLTKILAENQKEMLKLIAPLNKKQNVLINAHDSDFETENVSVARTSTPVKTHNTTNSKTTQVNCRNTNLDRNPAQTFKSTYYRTSFLIGVPARNIENRSNIRQSICRNSLDRVLHNETSIVEVSFERSTQFRHRLPFAGGGTVSPA